ncbi:MAG: orotidine 5'-phosphate decarboxylase [Candidatus Omnitrophica bacterium CG1_02_44_16]|nr:MAG: orotidine 5'-phosphate decarboxylase [Candidatus Omnitrophica bacterium CG1_02_44_16]PIY82886.1 MAG: orotidine-5'-phosphate decarboxylase [Candidatus Omnitrophica bacterium CG_4_10_14_0_8_um_filter_44_12]PIZ83908.1 MAG: orotidine-5'-phosphate decarboxylase [Candidatus Omnitrophica bacterium CG_4_10_14_0_2_um_filter_44_9]
MKPCLIVALDVDSFAKAKKLVDALCPLVKIFKVGSQLFTLAGPASVEYIKKKKADVFLDLKFHDIPNTVANALRSVVPLEVKMLTLHVAGGDDMLRAAVKAATDGSASIKVKRPLLIGVTVLTSKPAAPGVVLSLAQEAMDCGLDGVVCSVKEAELLRQNIGNEFVIVTPGIRLDGAVKDDQKRIATVSEAVAAGSDFIVVGRPIVEAPDPLAAAKEFIV